MSAVAERSAGLAGAAAGAGRRPSARRRHRLPEYVILGLGLVAAVVTMGGFTTVVNQMDEAAFGEIVAPVLLGEDPGRTAAEAYRIRRTLAARVGASLVALPLLRAVRLPHMPPPPDP